MADLTRITGELPSGEQFSCAASLDVIALRVADRTCLAAPRWMTTEQARDAAEALLSVNRA